MFESKHFILRDRQKIFKQFYLKNMINITENNAANIYYKMFRKLILINLCNFLIILIINNSIFQ